MRGAMPAGRAPASTGAQTCRVADFGQKRYVPRSWYSRGAPGKTHSAANEAG